jgi:hypothetical protein
MARAKPGTKRKKAGRGVRKVTAEARPRAKAVRKPARKAASRRAKPIRAPAPLLVTARNLSVVSFEPLHPEATAAFAAGDRVQLLVGRGEDGALVETLVFEPSGRAVQSQGGFVHRGEWNGTRILTDRGHTLDLDGLCFCRDCETAGGYTVDDDE